MDDSDKRSKVSQKSMRQFEQQKVQSASPHLPEWLEHGLRDLYQETLDEPLPKEFEDLLQKLESAKKREK